jgi:hypothetical protein
VTVTAPGYSTLAGAVTGVVLWVLQEYAFKGGTVPDALQGACWIIIPAAVTGITSLLTKRSQAAAAPLPPAPAPAHAPPGLRGAAGLPGARTGVAQGGGTACCPPYLQNSGHTSALRMS